MGERETGKKVQVRPVLSELVGQVRWEREEKRTREIADEFVCGNERSKGRKDQGGTPGPRSSVKPAMGGKGGKNIPGLLPLVRMRAEGRGFPGRALLQRFLRSRGGKERGKEKKKASSCPKWFAKARGGEGGGDFSLAVAAGPSKRKKGGGKRKKKGGVLQRCADFAGAVIEEAEKKKKGSGVGELILQARGFSEQAESEEKKNTVVLNKKRSEIALQEGKKKARLTDQLPSHQGPL